MDTRDVRVDDAERPARLLDDAEGPARRLDDAEGPARHRRRADDAITTSLGRTGLYFVLGGILTLIGLIGVGIYAFTPRNTPVEGDGTADGLWQAGLIIGSAVAGGVGVFLLLWGVVSTVRAQRED